MNEFNDDLKREGYWEEALHGGHYTYAGIYINGERRGYWRESWWPEIFNFDDVKIFSAEKYQIVHKHFYL